MKRSWMSPVVGDMHQQLAARLVGDFVRRDYAFHLRYLAAAHAGFADRQDFRFILIAHGKMQHQVHVRAQAKLGKLALGGGGWFFGCGRLFLLRFRHVGHGINTRLGF